MLPKITADDADDLANMLGIPSIQDDANAVFQQAAVAAFQPTSTAKRQGSTNTSASSSSSTATASSANAQAASQGSQWNPTPTSTPSETITDEVLGGVHNMLSTASVLIKGEQSYYDSLLGKNEKWYNTSSSFFGNPDIGSKAGINEETDNFEKLGQDIFHFETIVGGLDFAENIRKGDIGGAAKSLLDITMGAVGEYGGPEGFIANSGYVGLNMWSEAVGILSNIVAKQFDENEEIWAPPTPIY